MNSLFRVSQLALSIAIFLSSSLSATAQSASSDEKIDSLSTRQDFEFDGHRAFVMIPDQIKNKGEELSGILPWVWYAPTLGKNLPGSAEKWMFDRFHQAGIAIAGIDVGESYGSPTGREAFQKYYKFLTSRKKFSNKPVLLARSRGGLMLYSWATDHPESVGGIVGIYPVCNIASYPGTKNAARAYKLSADQLNKRLKEFNPIDRLQGLAKQRVPIFHIHGDSDKVVPLDANSAVVETRYKAFKGPIEVEVVKGQGHNMWKGWFTSEKLVQFVLKHTKSDSK